MGYKRSSSRADFEERLAFLRKKSRRAQRLKKSDADIRDLVFQATILLSSAALESYLKLVLEGWFFQVKSQQNVGGIPPAAKATLAVQALSQKFAHFSYSGDEVRLATALQGHAPLWAFLAPNAAIPSFFDGSKLTSKKTYPSVDNINRLFARVGLSKVFTRLDAIMGRDSEQLIIAFGSLRTALAHSQPPSITIQDIETNLDNLEAFVAAVDRLLHKHVVKASGAMCWP